MTGTQIARAKMTSVDAIFLQGKQVELSLSRSLLPQKTQKIYRSRFAHGKKLSARLVGKSRGLDRNWQGAGGVEIEGGSQLFETQKREG